MPAELEMEKRKAKSPSPLMSLKLGKVLEGAAQAPKRGRYLYNDEVKKQRYFLSLPPANHKVNRMRGSLFVYPTPTLSIP